MTAARLLSGCARALGSPAPSEVGAHPRALPSSAHRPAEPVRRVYLTQTRRRGMRTGHHGSCRRVPRPVAGVPGRASRLPACDRPDPFHRRHHRWRMGRCRRRCRPAAWLSPSSGCRPSRLRPSRRSCGRPEALLRTRCPRPPSPRSLPRPVPGRPSCRCSLPFRVRVT